MKPDLCADTQRNQQIIQSELYKLWYFSFSFVKYTFNLIKCVLDQEK